MLKVIFTDLDISYDEEKINAEEYGMDSVFNAKLVDGSFSTRFCR